MGLDMYINRKVRGYRKDDGTLSQDFNDRRTDEFGCSNCEWIESVVAYWRKANAIHKWLVDTVQDGDDDCREHDIDIVTLKELRDVCRKILSGMKGKVLRVPKKFVEDFKKTHAVMDGFVQRIVIDPDNLDALDKATMFHEVSDVDICRDILPTSDGCFFGSTEYDGVYFWQIAKTIRMIDRLLAQDEEFAKSGVRPDYTYCSSW